MAQHTSSSWQTRQIILLSTLHHTPLCLPTVWGWLRRELRACADLLLL